jgi:hypothetical protein
VVDLVSNKDLIDVIDEMLEKLDNEDSDIINQTQGEFDKELKEKLDAVAKSKGYETYNSMLVAQVSEEKTQNINPELAFILDFIENAIAGINYEPRQMGLYKEGHQEALYKYFEFLKETEDIDEALRLSYEEETSINKLDTLRDLKLKGYKDGLYLFSIILEDASEELHNKTNM